MLILCWPHASQRKYSVAKIDSSDTYEKGRPKAGGLSDLRMGTMDKAGGLVCTTDGANSIECPGYFGHIELAKVGGKGPFPRLQPPAPRAIVHCMGAWLPLWQQPHASELGRYCGSLAPEGTGLHLAHAWRTLYAASRPSLPPSPLAAQPMYHAGYIKTVIRVLRSVSYHTSKLLVDKVSMCMRTPTSSCPLRDLASRPLHH
jgi:hypothetical protein